jgi:hypothetical protein
MYTRRLNVREGTNRVFELAFERSLIIYLLIELGTDPVWLIEYFEPKPAILDSAFGGRCKPRLV